MPPVTDHIARHFIAAAEVAARLVTAPEVAARWTDESACAGMTVGGLAHHLAGQAENVGTAARARCPCETSRSPSSSTTAGLTWVTTGLDDEPNTSIRDEANDDAAGGPEQLAAEVERVLGALPSALAPSLAGSAPPDDRVRHLAGLVARPPRTSWSTRLMEIIVHSDDLAASVGLPDARVLRRRWSRPVLGLLSGVAVERHGQAAVLRALSRPQRAPGSVSAF